MSTETKFTPGPWKAYRYSSFEFCATPEQIAEHPNYWEVASQDNGLSVSAHMGEANAYLIAAAPALYEALEKIVADAPEAHEPYPAGGQSSADDEYERGAGNQHFYLANIARAALSRARGEV